MGVTEDIIRAAEQGGIEAPYRIVALCEYQGRLYVATEHRVYVQANGVFHPVIFADGINPAKSGG